VTWLPRRGSCRPLAYLSNTEAGIDYVVYASSSPGRRLCNVDQSCSGQSGGLRYHRSRGEPAPDSAASSLVLRIWHAKCNERSGQRVSLARRSLESITSTTLITCAPTYPSGFWLQVAQPGAATVSLGATAMLLTASSMLLAAAPAAADIRSALEAYEVNGISRRLLGLFGP
jgi:hypothetical protein